MFPFGLRAISAFPVLAGIESVTLLAEHNDTSVEAHAHHPYAAGREVIINEPIGGTALDDALSRRASR
jgi:hypothetical protein